MSQGQIEIFLQPGEHYFGDRFTRIRTLLGSCVAITLWHPRLLIGGMCHFLLPSRRRDSQPYDGRYGDEAMGLLLEAMMAHGTRPQEYEAKVFGGGNMFPEKRSISVLDVGLRNIEAAGRMLDCHGLARKAGSVGQTGHRNVFFDIATGHVWVRHVRVGLAAA